MAVQLDAGKLVMAGAAGDPVDHALFIFKVTRLLHQSCILVWLQQFDKLGHVHALQAHSMAGYSRSTWPMLNLLPVNCQLFQQMHCVATRIAC